MTRPYPSKDWYGRQGGPDWSGGMDVSNMTFVQFVNEVYKKFINVRNRKVIDDAHGGGYPTLRLIYQDYLDALTKCGKASNAYNYAQLISFVDVIQGYWLGLIEQVFPATTIWNSGVKYKNTVFDRQKYVYRHGIDDGSEFQKEMGMFEKEGSVQAVTVISSVPKNPKSVVPLVDTDGCWGNTVFATNEMGECINNYILVSPAGQPGTSKYTLAGNVINNNFNKDQGVSGLPYNNDGSVAWITKTSNLGG
tara:strand:- start:1392 stop:2141 length:750 start_codon:yes stop_codon:yes gene_type:complete